MAEDTMSEVRNPGRRSLIKAGAAGAVGVWAAPVVSSFTSPARAAGSAGNPNPECIGANCSTFIPCSSDNPDCVCTTTSSGGGFCIPGSTPCASLDQCGAGDSCPPGSVCIVDTCCGIPKCAPLDLNRSCPASTDGARAAQAPARRGASGLTVGY